MGKHEATKGMGLSSWQSRFRGLDRILRGDATRVSSLRSGTLEVDAAALSLVIVVLCMAFGLCMGTFALFRPEGANGWQIVASMLKVPALFYLTLIVTLPSLYVFNALVGSRLSLTAVVRLLMASIGVTAAVLASLGPIVAFFSLSTTSYPFMVLLNVAVFAASGFLGLAFLLQTLHRLSLIPPDPVTWTPPSSPSSASQLESDPEADPSTIMIETREPVGALDPTENQVLGKHVKTIFRLWMVVFGLVGAQMGWVLRPFIGNPGIPFTWFRGRESNFFQAVLQMVGNLFSA
jgi:hypothetical protein